MIRRHLKRHLGPTRAALRRIRAAIPAPRTAIDLELHSPWLQAYGFRTIVDVGANVGTFARIARSAFPTAHIYSFEPLLDCARRLEAEFGADPRFSLFPCALGSQSGETHMYENEYSASSSILTMAMAHAEAFPYTARSREVTVQMRTLDDALRDQQLLGPMLLKLDVQGYELNVLLGGRDTLSRAQVVLLEVSLLPMYEGAPLFDEVYRALDGAGFTLRGVVDVLRRPADGRPLQLDLVFERV